VFGLALVCCQFVMYKCAFIFSLFILFIGSRTMNATPQLNAKVSNCFLELIYLFFFYQRRDKIAIIFQHGIYRVIWAK